MVAAARRLAGPLLALALLVSIASSSVDKKQLKTLKKNVQTISKRLEVLEDQRAAFAALLELSDQYVALSSLGTLMKKTFPETFGSLPVESFLEMFEKFAQSAKTQGKAELQKLTVQIATLELELSQKKSQIRAAEEHQAEL